MSDSVANLTVKVDVKSVAAATKALEALASAAKAVETKINGLGGKATGLGKAQGDAAEGTKKASGALAAMEKRVDAATRQYEKTIRTINRANISESQRRNLITDTSRAYSSHLGIISRVNAGVLDLTRTNIAYRNSMSNVSDSVKRLESLEAQRVAAARKNARELEAIEKKRVADSIALQSRLQQAQLSAQGVTLRAGRQLSPEAAAGITRQAEAALVRYTTALNTYGVRSFEAGRAAGVFGMNMQALSSEIARVGGLLPRISDNARVFSAAFGAANASVGGFSRVLFNTLPAVQALLGAFALREITQSIMEFEKFTNTLRTVSGSVGDFNQNLRFLFAEAERIGFAVGQVGNSFARLSLAMKGAGFSADESKETFSQLAEAARNFGLSSADTMGVIRALEQSMSKGKFMAEEVRLQLGDRLPIAMAALERAITKVDGKQSDLNKRFEEGTLDVKRYGIEFVRQINLMSGGADTLGRTQNSIAAALGRLNNELTLVTKTFGEEGFSNAVIIATQNFIAFLQALRETGVISAAGAVMETLAKHTALLSTAIAGLALALSASLIAKFARFAVTLNPWGRAIGLILTAITAFVGLSEAGNKTQRALNNLTAASNNFNRAFDSAKGASEDFNEAMRSVATSTKSSNTEIENSIRVRRELGMSDVEITRLMAQESLKRLEISKAEMERNLKTTRDAVRVRRTALLEGVESLGGLPRLAKTISDTMQKRDDPATGEVQRQALDRELKTLASTRSVYTDLTNVLVRYISLGMDEKEFLEELSKLQANHADRVKDTTTAIRSKSDALGKDTTVVRAQTGAVRGLIEEEKRLRNILKEPEKGLVAFGGITGESPGPRQSPEETARFKKEAKELADAVKQFQDKYGDDKFIAQAKAVETVLTAARQKFADYGIAANASSEDTLLSLAANERFANSFPRLAAGVRRFAAEIDKARNPLRAQIADINNQVIQNEKLIAGLRAGGAAVAAVELHMLAHNEAIKEGAVGTEKYTKAYDAYNASLGRRTEQEEDIAALRNLGDMRDELALLEKEISLRGQSVAVQEEELAVTRALLSAKTTDPKILADIEKYTRAIFQRRRALNEEKNGISAYLNTAMDQIIQNDKLIESYSGGSAAVAAAQLHMQAHTRALEEGKFGTEEYTKAYNKLMLVLGITAEQQNKIAALDTVQSLQNELALLEKEISLRGQSVAVQEEELAVTRALLSAKTTDPKILADIEKYTRAIIDRRKTLDEAKNGVDAYVAATKIEMAEQRKVSDAYALGGEAVTAAKIAQEAHSEAIRRGTEYLSADYMAVLRELLPVLREKTALEKSTAVNMQLPAMRAEVEVLEKQVELLGKSKKEREQILAVFIATRLAEGADPGVLEEYLNLTKRRVAATLAIADADNNGSASTERAEKSLSKYTETLRIEIATHEGLLDAYKQSTLAGEDMEVQIEAQTKALDYGTKGSVAYKEALAAILPLMRERAQQEKDTEAVKANTKQRDDEIALLEKEQSLLGAGVALREQELAVLRARQQYRGAKPEDLAEIERNIRETVALRQQNQFLENSYNEVANIGTRAFEQVGDAITEAFSKGELRALRFGDIVRGVMSSIIQSILRIGIINPILNNLFPGGEMRPTFGGAMTAAAGGGGGAAGGGGSILSGLGQIFSAGRTVLSTGSLLGGAGGFAGYGAGMSGVLFGTPAIPAGMAGAGGATMGGGAAATSGLLGGGGQFSMAALGSTLGLAAGGFGAGTFANSLLGGNQTSGMIGSAIGTGIGLALTPILGPFAPILGGLIGGAGGGLIGPKPSSRGFSYNLGTQGGRLAPIDYRYFNEQGRAQFQEAEAGVAATNALLQQFGLTATGGRAVGGNRFGMGNLGYGEAASFSEAFKSLQFAATSNEELSRALSTRAFEGVEKLQEFLQGFVGLQETIKGLTADPVPEFKQQMDALINSFAEATAKAREYGIGEEELLVARDKQIAKLEEQRNLTIRDTALELEVRRLMAQGMDQEAERIELAYRTQKEIESFTASLETLGITAGEKSRLLIELEQVQALERAKILKESTKDIRDYLDSLKTGPLAGATVMSRLASSQDLFARDLSAAQSGDAEALGRVTQTADVLLNLAREAYGSTSGFQNIRGGVVSGLEGLLTTAQAAPPLADLSSVPLVSELRQMRDEAAILEAVQYSKQFDEKLGSLLPIAEAIQQAVEQSKEAAVALYDYVSAGGGGDVDGDISGPPGPEPTAELFALGGVFRHGRVTAYANGGIPDYVNRPTMAPMALFGEAGPEAIMPLRRGPDGRLGVEVNGSGNQAVVVELRAVRQEIINLRGSVEEADNDEGGGVVEAIAELRIQIGGLREELRTNRLRAQ